MYELPGVYAVGHAAPSVEGELSAALLFAGRGSMLSHATALWWVGLLDHRPTIIDITTPKRAHSHGRIRIHGRRQLERVWHKGFPMTPVAQALLDFARVAQPDRIRYVLSQAEYHGLLDLDEIEATIGRGKAGSAKLREAIDQHMPQLARTKSEMERLFLALCEAAHIPLPGVNQMVAGLQVDAVWRAERVVVELDGARGHLSRARMVRDRRRDVTLRAAGFAVLRYTWDQLTQEPDLVIADLVRALAARAA